LAASQSVFSDDKYWWDTRSGSEDSDTEQDEFKDGSTWLKSNTKLNSGFQRQVDGHIEEPLRSKAGDTRQPITNLPLALSASDSSSRSNENFTHDSLGMK